ncbi:MAG: hypothetical protein AB7F22_29655 [Reyranella sp.]
MSPPYAELHDIGERAAKLLATIEAGREEMRLLNAALKGGGRPDLQGAFS